MATRFCPPWLTRNHFSPVVGAVLGVVTLGTRKPRTTYDVARMNPMVDLWELVQLGIAICGISIHFLAHASLFPYSLVPMLLCSLVPMSPGFLVFIFLCLFVPPRTLSSLLHCELEYFFVSLYYTQVVLCNRYERCCCN